MNDVYRGAVIVVALVAFYFAARLAVAYLDLWHRRHRIAVHVLWMALGLTITTRLVIDSLVDRLGDNTPLTGQEWLRLPQVAAITAGLRPLWVYHQARPRRQEVRHG